MRAPSVMLVVDPRTSGVLDALGRVRASVSGERVAVQLRMKEATDAERIAAARELAGMLPVDALLIVNESVAVARGIAADGVHLPESGGSVADARAALPVGAVVGCSCHDLAGATRRAGEGADYLVLGPLGEVPGKPAMSEAAFHEVTRSLRAPVLALGGIASVDDVMRAREVGASGVAIQRALLAVDAVTLIRAALQAFP